MAARYWVTGGTGATNSTTNWSTTSGGASGASVPVSTDDAIFDSNSGTGIVTINATLSVLNFDSTNFGGTFAGSSLIAMNGGTLKWGAGVTINWSGNISCGTGSSGTSFTSNGKQIVGTIIIATGFPNPGTLNFIDTFKCGCIQHVTAAGVLNLDGADIHLIGNAITFSATSGRTIQGTSHIYLKTTNAALTISMTGRIKNSITIDATNPITQTSGINIEGGTWNYLSGTWNHAGNPISIYADTTLDLAGMTIGRILTGAAATCTLNSLLDVAADIQYSLATGFIFAGAYGFRCATLTHNASATGRVITLSAGAEYFVTSSLDLISGAATSKPSIKSGTPGTRAKLTLSQGVTIDSAYCDFTDIDAGNGATICTYNGVVSNCINVQNIPKQLQTTIY